jgi:Tfp pilus assembly protein PilO
MPHTKPQPQSAAAHLEHRTDKYLMVIIILLVVSIVVWFVLYSLGKQQISELKLTQQEIESTFVSDQNLNLINQFVDANSLTLLKVNDFFPNEANIIQTLESIEAIVKTYDDQATVKISSTQPVPKDDQLQIPLIINLNTSLEGLTRLLREIEKLPLILEINSTNLLHTSENALQITLGINLYVDDPFIPAPANPSN